MKRIFTLIALLLAFNATVFAQALPGGGGLIAAEFITQNGIEGIEVYNPTAQPITLATDIQFWEQTGQGSPFYTMLTGTTVSAGGRLVLTGWPNTLGSGCECIGARNASTGECVAILLHPGGSGCPVNYDNLLSWTGFPQPPNSTVIDTVYAGMANVVTLSGNSLQLSPEVDGEWQECAQTPGMINCPALPIEIAEWSARLSNQIVLATLVTATELNNRMVYFQRRSPEGFITLDSIPGQGTTPTGYTYQFTDYNPLTGWNYYRIRQVDYDRKETVSELVAVLVGSTTNELEAFPNPVRNNLFIGFPEGVTSFLVWGKVTGQVISEVNIAEGQSSYQLDVSALSPGSYRVTAYRGTEPSYQISFIKQ